MLAFAHRSGSTPPNMLYVPITAVWHLEHSGRPCRDQLRPNTRARNTRRTPSASKWILGGVDDGGASGVVGGVVGGREAVGREGSLKTGLCYSVLVPLRTPSPRLFLLLMFDIRFHFHLLQHVVFFTVKSWLERYLYVDVVYWHYENRIKLKDLSYIKTIPLWLKQFDDITWGNAIPK